MAEDSAFILNRMSATWSVVYNQIFYSIEYTLCSTNGELLTTTGQRSRCYKSHRNRPHFLNRGSYLGPH